MRALARKTVTDDFKIFSDRLSKLMKERNITQEQLAHELGVKRQTVSLYKNGQSTPDAAQLKNIAMFFGVSADWLLGLSDTPTTSGDVKQVCNFIGLSEKVVNCLHQLNALPDLRKEAALDIVSEVALSAGLFSDCILRSALAMAQAKKSNLIDDPEGWRAYWGKRDVKNVEEAFKPMGGASDGIEIHAIEAAMLYRIQAVENIKQAAEKVTNKHREELTTSICKYKANSE